VSSRWTGIIHRRVFRLLLFALALGGFVAETACGASFYYTFGERRGGVARLEIDPDSGRVLAHEVLPAPPGITHPQKMALSASGDRLLVTSDAGESGWLFALEGKPRFIREIALMEETSDVRAQGEHALVAVSKGYFFWVNLTDGKVEKQWNAREELRPSGRKGEHIRFLPDGKTALITFQKDSKKGKHRGSRLVVFDLPSFRARYDLELPRDRPDLHINKDEKEQGPNPELVFIAPRSNTVLLTLDLYGAIAFADYGALLRGKWKHLEQVPSSMDGSWGSAFPDRGTLFEKEGREYFLVANASKDGGIALFDVAKRRIIGRFPASAGGEPPIYLPRLSKAVTVISGKLKTRTLEGLHSRNAPGNDLLLLDLGGLGSGPLEKGEAIPLHEPVYRIAAVDPQRSPLVLLATGEGAATRWVIYDVAARKVVGSEPAKGKVSRLITHREGS